MKTTGTVYVVFGTTGVYADRDEWPVRAFTSRRRAETLARRAAGRAAAMIASGEIGVLNKYDPHMRVDSTAGAVEYLVKEVPFDSYDS